MTWKTERDVLMAQTLAFVQSVTGKPVNTARPAETRLPPVSPTPRPTLERPADVLPSHPPIGHGDLRDEIRRRVAAFRARQQVFERDRVEYCNAMMEKARAASQEAVKTRDNRPLKR